MDWIIAVSKAERAAEALSPETAEAAFRALRVEGVAILRGLFSETFVDGLYKEYIAQFGALNAGEMNARAKSPPPHPFLKVGGKRYDITPRIVGAFADPAIFADPILMNILRHLLGSDLKLGGFTIVVSFPEAPGQHIHRDHPQLFPEGNLGSVLPAHAINVAVPLVDVDIETGPTGIWLGSHRWADSQRSESGAMTRVPYQRGDAVLVDYRTLHTGLPNQSRRMRPVLYMVYSRTWFSDDTNYKNRTSLNMPLETYRGLPEAAQDLLLRAYSQAMRSRQVAEAHAQRLIEQTN
jgi:hypothetical protein